MKRILLALLIATLAVGGAFAADLKLSAGAGLVMAGQLSGGGAEGSVGSISVTQELTDSSYGAYGFFDATYVEVTVGYFSSSGTLLTKTVGYSVSYATEMSGFNLSLFGKYPFALAEKFSLFPLVGIDYQMVTDYKVKLGYLSGKLSRDGKNIDPTDFSSLWIKGGVGGDISFTDAIYMRIEGLFGIGLPSKYANDGVKIMKDAGASGEATIGTGYTFKLAVGFRF